MQNKRDLSLVTEIQTGNGAARIIESRNKVQPHDIPGDKGYTERKSASVNRASYCERLGNKKKASEGTIRVREIHDSIPLLKCLTMCSTSSLTCDHLPIAAMKVNELRSAKNAG